MGIPAAEDENLKSVVRKVFSLIGCVVSNNAITGCYRIKKGAAPTDIIIVKLYDKEVKHVILKNKLKKEVRLNDVMGVSSEANPLIYINHHLTPFFGKLLAEGRRAVREKKVHSVRLTSAGCQVRFEENGKERTYKSVGELHSFISSSNGAKVTTLSHKRTRSEDEEVDDNTRRLKK